MNVLKFLLYPLAAFYNGIMRVRNHLFDIGQKPSFQFEAGIIAVGNLNVGGSGKTPMVEYLITLLKDRYPMATLSRGYKRTTTGYRLTQVTDTALTVGDEAFQVFRKFGAQVKITVGEDRVFAIPHILNDFPQTRVIVLDDAFQQRGIRASVSILLTDCMKPFYRDFVLPFGRLREARSGARRADIVVVTKCSAGMNSTDRDAMSARISAYSGPKPIFFSTIGYDAPRPFGIDQPITKNVIVVSGIATSDSLDSYCERQFHVLKYFRFADHHRYTMDELVSIEQFGATQQGSWSILTTEKDMVRLIGPEFQDKVKRMPWFYLPIRHSFLQDGSKFDSLVVQALEKPERQE